MGLQTLNLQLQRLVMTEQARLLLMKNRWTLQILFGIQKSMILTNVS